MIGIKSILAKNFCRLLGRKVKNKAIKRLEITRVGIAITSEIKPVKSDE